METLSDTSRNVNCQNGHGPAALPPNTGGDVEAAAVSAAERESMCLTGGAAEKAVPKEILFVRSDDSRGRPRW